MYTWASASRYQAKVGWYSQQPWYTESGYRESTVYLTPEDIEKADRIGHWMLKIRESHPLRELCCRYYYGAFPGAEHMKRSERVNFLVNEFGISKRDVYRERDDAIMMVEGALLLT